LQKKTAEDTLFTLLHLNLQDSNDRGKFDGDKDKRWAKVELLLTMLPNAFRRKYIFIKLWETEFHPLGMLLVLKAPQNLIKKVFDCCPEAANDAFAIGCSYGAEIGALKCLLETAPGAVQHLDAETKNAPLHEACLVCNNTNASLVQFLYHAYPLALTTGNDDGETPLHFACEHGIPEVVRFFLEQGGSAAEQRNNKGVLPLASAMENTKLNADYDILALLVRAYPDSMNESDVNGNKLLSDETSRLLTKHLAIQMGSPSATA
jgi:hypothetical protein